MPLFDSIGTRVFNSPRYLYSDRSVTESNADILRLLTKDPLCCMRNWSSVTTRCLLDLHLISRANSVVEMTDVEGWVVCIVEQVFVNEDAKVFFYFKPFLTRLKMTEISVSNSNPIWLIIRLKCVLMGSLGCFLGMTKIKTRILITKKARYL